MKPKIKVRAIKAESQDKYGGHRFAGVVVIGGSVVGHGTGFTKREARNEGKRAAEEMGLWTDGVGYAR